MNAGKLLILKDLLPLVTSPQPATNLDDLAQALEPSDTNLLLFKAAGRSEPEPGAKRLAFVGILPPDVAAHVSMHLDEPAYSIYATLKAFSMKYVKVIMGLAAARRAGRRTWSRHDSIPRQRRAM